MQYLITFFEGLLTFLSPCFLPMLPIYLSYLAGAAPAGDGERPRGLLLRAGGFVVGFTLVFLLLGAAAGTVGSLVARHQTWVDVVGGAVVILFGLNFLGVLRLPFLSGAHGFKKAPERRGFFAAVLLGMVFSLGWTPCVGAFLGSALMLAAGSTQTLRGILLLLCYSAGLGVPFLLSAALVGQLEAAFSFFRRHMGVIHKISGALLVALGVLMATGLLGAWLRLVPGA